MVDVRAAVADALRDTANGVVVVVGVVTAGAREGVGTVVTGDEAETVCTVTAVESSSTPVTGTATTGRVTWDVTAAAAAAAAAVVAAVAAVAVAATVAPFALGLRNFDGSQIMTTCSTSSEIFKCAME